MKRKMMWRVTNSHGDSWVQPNRPKTTIKIEGEFIRKNITVERVLHLS